MEGMPNCRDCLDLQHDIPAVAFIGKTPVCQEHKRQRLGIPRKPEPLPIGSVTALKVKEGTPMERLCKCGCGEKLRKDSRRDYKMGHEPAGSAPPAKRPHAHSNGSFAVNLTAVGLDAVWNALTSEKKAELLSHL